MLESSGGVSLYSVDGSPPRRLAGEGGTPVHWSGDSRWLYLREALDAPARVYRRDLLTDRVEPWKDLIPADPAAVGIVQGPVLSPDGRTYAYGFSRILNDLYLVDGLR